MKTQFSEKELNDLIEMLRRAEEEKEIKMSLEDDFNLVLEKFKRNEFFNLSLEELFWTFFIRGYAVALKYQKDIPFEQIDQDVKTNLFLEEIKDYILKNSSVHLSNGQDINLLELIK